MLETLEREDVIVEPFIIEGWDDEPKCESAHWKTFLRCSTTAYYVMKATCNGVSGLWCKNRYEEYLFNRNDDYTCFYCDRFIADCWEVREL